MASFGKTISDARKKARLSQKQLAAKIKKEDGEAISPQYLNDIEHDRRNPSGEYLIEQFAKVLGLPKDSLMAAAGTLPQDIRQIAADKPDQVAEAFKLLRAKSRSR